VRSKPLGNPLGLVSGAVRRRFGRVRAGRNWRVFGLGSARLGKELLDLGLGHVAAEGVFEIGLEVAFGGILEREWSGGPLKEWF